LPATNEAYLAGLSKHRRAHLGRRERQLGRACDATARTLRGQEAATLGLDILFKLHCKRWESMGRKDEDNLARPEVEAFHRKVAPLLAERDLIRCYLIESPAGPIAILYGFRAQAPEGGLCFYFFQMGHDPEHEKYSPGAVVMAVSIRGAIEEGCATLEMLRGDEPYKAQWKTGNRTIHTMRVARHGWGATLLQAERGLQFLRTLVG
jgi:CelD/BcsL family acetyltransferase involved in cellulose biosynthesis